MNTLSSILNFLGVTLGANPNTLTTTNKTIIGAINEVDAAIDSRVHISTSVPTSGDGENGDVWLVYEEEE